MSSEAGIARGVGSAPVPLPHGRHKLSPDAVRANQRVRLLEAMLDSVARRGYGATTVPDVVASARVSRNAFYALFTDKLDCFLALCEELGEQLLAETFEPGDASDWRAALRAGARRYLRWWQSRPQFSRAYLVELPVAGTDAIAYRDRTYARFGERFALLGEWARTQDRGLAQLRPVVPRVLVAAITDLITAEIDGGRIDRLHELEDEIVWLVERLLTEPA
jgi:AcrR family transcriptional regulator